MTGKTLIAASVTSTTSSTNTTALLTSSAAGALQSVSGAFTMARFEYLKLTLFPPTFGAAATVLAIGYSNELCDTAPNSVSGIAQLPYSVITTYNTSVPVSFTVPMKYLVGDNAAKWWRTEDGSTTDAWDETQGTFWFRSDIAAASAINVMIEYAVALSSPVGTSFVPQKVRRNLCQIKGWDAVELEPVGWLPLQQGIIPKILHDFPRLAICDGTSGLKVVERDQFSQFSAPKGKGCKHDFTGSEYTLCSCVVSPLL